MIDSERTVLVTANTAWNIYNFRLALIRKIIASGYRIVVVAKPDEYKEKLIDEGLDFFSININERGINPFEDLLVILAYIRLFLVTKPNIILSFTVKPNLYGSIAARVLGIPIVSNVSGLGTLFVRTTWVSRIGRILYRFCLRSNKHVFFQNSDDQVLFESTGLIAEGMSSVIPGSGIDFDYFNVNREVNIGRKFVFVGRLIRDKGIIEYLQAADKILSMKLDIEFYIVGELGSSNVGAITLDELLHFTDKNGSVKYLGRTDDIKAILAQMDVLVLPSYREGLSRALVEGAAMKLPIITTDAPGCKDLVDVGLNGFLCEVKSVNSLVTMILSMIKLSDAERLEFGSHGRVKAKSLFSNDTVFSRYSKVIKLYAR